MKKIKVYIVNVLQTDIVNLKEFLADKEQFMNEAEKQGTVYTLKGFEKAFNREEISSETQFIKII